jgi:hypothetical protein
MTTTTSTTNSTSTGTVMGNVENVPVNCTYTESGRSTTSQRDDRLADLAVQRGRVRIGAAQSQASDIMRRALRVRTPGRQRLTATLTADKRNSRDPQWPGWHISR